MRTRQQDTQTAGPWLRITLACVGLIYSANSGAQTPAVSPSKYARPIPKDSLPAYVRRQPSDNPVIQKIWDEGMLRSRAASYLQILSDSLGPRLTGSPGTDRAQQWLLETYKSLGIPARREEYGKSMKWERGVSHLDLIAPRVRTLSAVMPAWSPGTEGRTVTAEVIARPDVHTQEEFKKWLPQARGKIVLLSPPSLSCRPEAQWQRYGSEESRERLAAQQDSINNAWEQRHLEPGLKDAGVVGVLTTSPFVVPFVRMVMAGRSQTLPNLQVDCEDYGLLARLVERNQHPQVQMLMDARFLGEQPVFNVVGELRGSEKPNEYVILSAHFDSWDGASGTTDNGTGSIMMLEAMRILKTTYPNPKRTILVGHWTGEEQGILGSQAFVAKHPEIVAGAQIAFNQDNGTGRIIMMGSGAFPPAEPTLLDYLSHLPSALTQSIRIEPASNGVGGGSDHQSFVEQGVPLFSMTSLDWNYDFTWHTNVDTYDKFVEEDLRSNATLMAMLAYEASENPKSIRHDSSQTQKP